MAAGLSAIVSKGVDAGEGLEVGGITGGDGVIVTVPTAMQVSADAWDLRGQ